MKILSVVMNAQILVAKENTAVNRVILKIIGDLRSSYATRNAPHIPHESEQQLEALKIENEQLKLQVATLEKALGLVGGR